jgi:hypothetical protein
MQCRFALLPLAFLLVAASARAQPLAPASSAGCVSARVEVLGESAAQALYRIVFVNRCGTPRNFFWCAENASAAIPAALACPRGRGFPAEPRHAISQRKEFQWHLPRGSRIRVHDCADRDIPTADFGCAAP